MGGRSDADIFLARPVGTVVAGKVTGTGKIGNLVMEISGFGQPVDQGGEKGDAQIFFYGSHFPCFLQLIQGCPFFIY